MKKLLSLILALAMLLTVMAGLMASASAEEDTFHIGIVTGSVSQSEDDRRGAEAFQEKYGEDRVKLAIYPDNFTEELETTIQTIVNLSDDPEMKAIILLLKKLSMTPERIASLDFKERQKLAAKFYRKGFRSDNISKALRLENFDQIDQ